LNQIVEKVMVETLCSRYRLIARGTVGDTIKGGEHDGQQVYRLGKFIQRRHNVGWRDIETWPLGPDGGTMGAAIRFMNTLADLEDNKS